MKKTKVTNNQIESKPIHFHFSTDGRHIDLGLLLKTVYAPLEIASKKSKKSIKIKTNQNEKAIKTQSRLD